MVPMGDKDASFFWDDDFINVTGQVPVPGLGRAVPLVLIHPEDISERWDGGRTRGHFNVFMKLVAQHVDLSEQEKSVDPPNQIN